MADANGRLNFNVDPELHRTLLEMNGSGEIKSVSAFCRDAITEKLAGFTEDHTLAQITDAYKQLNGDARQWLLQAVRLVSGNPDARK